MSSSSTTPATPAPAAAPTAAVLKFTVAQLNFLFSEFGLDHKAVIAKTLTYVPRASTCTATKKDGCLCTRKVLNGETKCSLHREKVKKAPVPGEVALVCSHITKAKVNCKRKVPIGKTMCTFHFNIAAKNGGVIPPSPSTAPGTPVTVIESPVTVIESEPEEEACPDYAEAQRVEVV